MLRIGSIGSGGRGRIVKRAHRPEEGVVLAMICDCKQEVIDDYQSEFGSDLKATDNWEDVIANDDLDAVFITTPDFLHEEQTVAALKAGKSVYLEKPMAITIEGCDRILNALEQSSGRLYVGHNMRFFPVMQKMKELIDARTIGDVQAIWCRHFIDYGADAYFKDWHSERKYSTSLLLQKGAHDLDLIQWFAGGYPQRTVGMGKLSVYNQVTHRRDANTAVSTRFEVDNWPPLSQTHLSPVIDVEDHSMMLIQMDNGVQASYEQCHYTPDGWRNYTIIGTHGRIENDGCHSNDQREANVRVWTKRCGKRIDDFETIPIPQAQGSHGGADPRIIDDFIRFIKTGESQGATPVDARMSVAVGVLATQSLREGNQPFDIPLVGR